MRRAFSLLLALLLLALPLAACTAERKEAEDGLQIVATNFPLYDFARRVAGEDASVRLLLSPGAEPHGYEPSPSDMKAVSYTHLDVYKRQIQHYGKIYITERPVSWKRLAGDAENAQRLARDRRRRRRQHEEVRFSGQGGVLSEGSRL